MIADDNNEILWWESVIFKSVTKISIFGGRMITGNIWTLNVGQNTFKLSDIVFIECAGKRSNKR